MPLPHDIPIFDKTYELYRLFYLYLSSFPKKDRYALGHKCEAVILELIEGIIIASATIKQEKLPILKKLSIKVDLLKVLFRLGKDLKMIDEKKYINLEEKLQEIGKMLGGWIRTHG